NDNAAPVRLEKAHDVRQGNGLADAATPDNRDGLPIGHVKVAIDQHRAIEFLINVAEFNVIGAFFGHARRWFHSSVSAAGLGRASAPPYVVNYGDKESLCVA